MSELDVLQLRPSPLHLDGYFIRKLSFSVSDDMDNESLSPLVLKSGFHPYLTEFSIDTSLKFNITFEVGTNKEDPSRYKFTLGIVSAKREDIKQVYDFEIEIIGYFTWMADKDLPDLQKTVQTSAITLMYASAREALASATARSPFPALVLPTAWISFTSSEDKLTTKELPSKGKKNSSKTNTKTRKTSKKS